MFDKIMDKFTDIIESNTFLIIATIITVIMVLGSVVAVASTSPATGWIR